MNFRKNIISKWTLITLIWFFLIINFNGCAKWEYTGEYEFCGASGVLYELKSDGTFIDRYAGNTGEWKVSDAGMVVSKAGQRNGEYTRVYGKVNSSGRNSTTAFRTPGGSVICKP